MTIDELGGGESLAAQGISGISRENVRLKNRAENCHIFIRIQGYFFQKGYAVTFWRSYVCLPRKPRRKATCEVSGLIIRL